MTSYEMDEIAQKTAKYLAKEIMGNPELMDAMFPEPYIGVEEAAKFMGMTVYTLYGRMKEVPHKKIGNSCYFSKRKLAAYMDGRI